MLLNLCGLLLGCEIAESFSAIEDCFDWCFSPENGSWNRKLNVQHKCMTRVLWHCKNNVVIIIIVVVVVVVVVDATMF